jgi:hypothetical protein
MIAVQVNIIELKHFLDSTQMVENSEISFVLLPDEWKYYVINTQNGIIYAELN